MWCVKCFREAGENYIKLDFLALGFFSSKASSFQRHQRTIHKRIIKKKNDTLHNDVPPIALLKQSLGHLKDKPGCTVEFYKNFLHIINEFGKKIHCFFLISYIFIEQNGP